MTATTPVAAVRVPAAGLRHQVRGAAVVSVAPESDLGRWLQQGRATAAIVRPDSYVMQAGRNTQAICDAAPAFSSVAGATEENRS